MAVLLACSTPALAHGPCRCLSPSGGEPGTSVRVVDQPAVEVVWNPSRDRLSIGPEALWSRHRPGAPTLVLARSRRPTPGARFEVPDVPAGTYLVATFDGGEGGVHYTWDSFRVVAAGSGRDEHRDAYELTFWLTIAGGVVLLGDVLLRLRASRRRRGL